jgi:hypothetical protein
VNLLSDGSFQKLKNKFNTVNIFEVLKVESSENRNTDIMAWLLNPSGTHGCGNFFVRKLLPVIFPSVRYFDFDCSFQINRELFLKADGRIDLILDGGNQIFAIENKIFTVDHGGQLGKYRKHLDERFKGYNIHYCYLTLRGDAPREKSEQRFWNICGHDSLIRELKNNEHLWRESPGRGIIDDYILNMERNLLRVGEELDISEAIMRDNKDLDVDMIRKIMRGVTDDATIMALKYLAESVPKRYEMGRGFFATDGIFRAAFCAYFTDIQVPIQEVGALQTTYFGLNFISDVDSRSLIPVRLGFRLEGKFLSLTAAIQPKKESKNSTWNDDRSYILENLGEISKSIGENVVPPRGKDHVTFWRKKYPFNPSNFHRSNVEEELYDWMERNEIEATYKVIYQALIAALGNRRRK